MAERITSVYGLDLKDETQTITVPKGSKVLGAFVHHESLGITIEHCCDPYSSTTPKEKIEFAVFNHKRHFFVDDYTYVGTVILDFGNEIYQVFYKKL